MKRKVEATWAITRVHHERNRYIFNMHYKERKISKELLDYLIKEGYADPALIAKWRKVCSAHASTQTSTHTQINPPNSKGTSGCAAVHPEERQQRLDVHLPCAQSKPA